ncbi:hypothetical protein SEMRO_89_G046960.1 [Seminavis robusta]|uniref:Uncharacterized protein n=1 Tax=Seminavis robusta TaxID=568900 RepID=A0A9N8DET1_9STRA|nr:hypothetical protein SEMRO_89_G046960.1 [Seminavis robusta]|eukprot:Sro89_g046960.1 n/a (103) ;mRNA; f:67146-67454
MASKDTKNDSMGACEPTTENETNHSSRHEMNALPITKKSHCSFAAKKNCTPQEKEQTSGPSPTKTEEETLENSAKKQQETRRVNPTMQSLGIVLQSNPSSCL